MSRFIDADKVEKYFDECIEDIHYFDSADEAEMRFLEAIDKVPTEDVAPVVHGSLKHTGSAWSHLWICTKCKGITYYPPHGNRKKRIIQPCAYKFCPNCGAKMDKEDTEP